MENVRNMKIFITYAGIFDFEMTSRDNSYDWTDVRRLFTEGEISELSEKISVGTPIWQHWESFVEDWRLTRRSELTIRNVRDALRFFAIHGNLLTIEDWNDTRKAFLELHRMGRERGWSGSTINTYRKNANTFFRHLHNMGTIEENKITRIPKTTVAKKNYDVLTMEDYAKIGAFLQARPCTNQLERKRNILFVLLMAET